MLLAFLTGTDVARKVVILARKCGLPVELDSMRVESLVPKELESCSIDEFMAKLPEVRRCADVVCKPPYALLMCVHMGTHKHRALWHTLHTLSSLKALA